MRPIAAALALSLAVSLPLSAQERGAAALVQAVDGLGVTTRVLMVGAHPDDEDTQLIAWLARGRRVETAYLSLTRGDGGQNLIGNELGEALGAIRTEELLAARRVDGGTQFFTRAYDFGFSKSAEETYRHWPKDTLLGDVVRVVRAFRPHVIVAVFSGTPRDGHGHHQVSGLLAREAYEVAGDTTRYARAAFGVPWTPLKFYRARRGNAEGASVRMNAGEYDPVLGRSPAEIAGESRSQHKSQGFGALERMGAAYTHVLREAARVGPQDSTTSERSIFDGIDTTWARFAGVVTQPSRRAALDSLDGAFAAVRAALDVRRPESLVEPLARAARLLESGLCGRDDARGPSPCGDGATGATGAMGGMGGTPSPDLQATRRTTIRRLHHALQLAVGVELEARTPRERLAAGRPESVTVTIYNRGTRPVRVSTIQLEGFDEAPELLQGAAIELEPGTAATRGAVVAPTRTTEPWWLANPRAGDLFDIGDGAAVREPWRYAGAMDVIAAVQVDGATTVVEAPVVYRYADPVRGDVSRPAAVVPAVAVSLDRPLSLAPANAALRRTIGVRLRSADTAQRQVTVRLRLPAGLTADAASRTVTLAGYDAQATVTFALAGRLAPGRDTIRVTAESGGETFDVGYQLVDYDHIRPQRLYRPAEVVVEAVEVTVPAGLTVAYVPGVSDNVAPALRELGVDVTVVQSSALASTDLSRFGTVVVGPRAYEAYPAVMAQRERLLDWARAGGTLVVQYQQYEVQRPGVAPYPMTVARPHDRVTIEEAPVTVVDAAAAVLAGPNRIGPADFAGWVQERSLYMPRTFDERYRAPLEMHDPDMPPNRGAVLVAPLGRGTYVYTTLSLFRQLPAGVPGAARLFVNLLAAGRPVSR